LKASFLKHTLIFKTQAQTSREVLQTKETYLLTIENEGGVGVGECALFKGLSYDNPIYYEDKLKWICANINLGIEILYSELMAFPSIQFGLEQAFINLNYTKHLYFPSKFTQGKDAIKINGLIWMSQINQMQQQIEQKIELGFSCIKLKIGHLDWENELLLIKNLRKQFSAEKLEIRVDANGAFLPKNVNKILNQLAELEIHSIEQPIKQGQASEMKQLCRNSPIPIALDEELIGVFCKKEKRKLLEQIQPQFIILKPSLIGGFKGSEEWISVANELNVNWWITSALESNIGLNAIAQWTYSLQNPMPQGLGTGNLFSNNFSSPLYLQGENLCFNPEANVN
jgi:o-succinylbenzoate synthase